MIRTYFVRESLLHDSGPSHPESAERARTLRALLTGMEKEGTAKMIEPHPSRDLSLFRLAHDPAYIDFLERHDNRLPIDLDPDTRLSSGSLDAMRGIAGAINMINLEKDRSQPVFLVARPPGHHARRGAGMGFCLVNTAAAQAISLLQSDPTLRIAIYDFDVHHGNGTEEILGAIPGTLYISTRFILAREASGRIVPARMGTASWIFPCPREQTMMSTQEPCKRRSCHASPLLLRISFSFQQASTVTGMILSEDSFSRKRSTAILESRSL